MSTTIDQKVVEMRFDNKQFESGVQTSMSTLDKLKQSLNLNGASKGLDSISKAASNVDFSGMSNGVETVRARFSALQVMGITALSNITNSAVNAGKKIVSALTIDPIKTGFQEYETQINAIQTILANTQKEGTTVKDVNSALDELNTYADKTIYNFTEMTRNIGTFTAAGVDLKTSVNAIQGIANLAAVSGSTSQQASTAMYQLSQALATGTIRLMDWNSVVNAGMGGQLFQDALKETSKLLGTGAEAAIKAKGSFRESLQTGWLTSEVLTETLKKFTTSGATEQVAKYTGLSKEAVSAALEEAEARYGEADAIEQASKALAKKSGKNADEIKSALQFAKTAEDAATKVKTLTQLWDTLKEAAQSGWAQTWRIIVGDFEEAKSLFTEISDTLGGLINKSAEARNKVLKKWSDLGGRNDLIESLRNVFEGLSSIVKPINDAFKEIFPPITAKQLFAFTEGLKNLTAKIKISDETADKLKRTFKGLFSIMDFGKKVLLTIGGAIAKLLGSEGMASLVDFILTITASLGDFFTSINEGFKMDGLSGILSNIVEGISNVIKSAVNGLNGFGDILSSLGKVVSDVAGNIWDSLVKVFMWITDNVSAGDIFAGLAGGGILSVASKLSGILKQVSKYLKGMFSGKGKDKNMFSEIKETVTSTLDSLHDSLAAFARGIKVASLVSIAIAVGILSASLKTLSKLKGEDIAKSLSAIGSMMVMLSLTFRSLTKSLTKFDSKGIVKSSAALTLVAVAIKILSDAMVKLSDLSLGEIGKGLIGVGGGLTALSVGLKIIGKTKISLSTSIAMIALAESCKMLGDAMEKFGKMSWDEIKRGLSGMGGALAEFVASLAILNKFGGFKSLLGSAGLLVAVQSLDEISENLKKFGKMSWDEIKRGLTGMGSALTEVSVVTGALGKLAGFSGLLGAGSILITVQGLGDLADSFKKFGNMTWDQIKAGLVGMGGALAEVGAITGSLGKLAGFSGILGAGAILITVQGLEDLANALKRIGEMGFDTVKVGLAGLGGTLGELGIVLGGLGKLAGLSSIFASGAILITIQGLGDLVDAFKKFGEMTWDQIKAGLVGMGGALAEVGAITGTLGKLTGLSGLLGAGSLLMSIQGLGDLAKSFTTFGNMTWDQIKAGLAGMGGALTEVAVITGTLGKLTGLSGLLGAGSLLLAVKDLGELADAFKIFGEMSWDQIKAGLVGMGGALTEVAVISGLLGTFAGIGALLGGGALLLSAKALGTIAQALGTLSDSVKKWTGVTIPENLGSQLASLAKGVLAFTFDGLGANAISTVAEPLGTLANSVKKWANVTVPEGIGGQLSSLASAVRKFTFTGLGAGAISSVAEPLGALATSVKKWSNVTVPDNLGESLGSIAEGVKAFSWLFVAGWSLSAITGPLGTLANSVNKWNGVTIPSGIKDGLSNLASGLKSFTWLFVAGWSLSTITGPLNNLADSLKKINGIQISSNIKTQLTNVADGIKSFSGTNGISSASSNIKSIASSISKLSTVNFNSVNSGLDSFGKSIKSLSSISGSLSNIGTKITSCIVTPIKKVSGQLKSAGSNIINSLVNGIKSKSSSVTSSMNSIVSKIVSSIKSKSSQFSSAGSALITAFANGIGKNKSKVNSAISSTVSSAASKIRGYHSRFYTSGTYLGSGLVSGINSKKSEAYSAGYALGQAAVRGEKDGQKSRSPSKLTIQAGKWLGEGLVIGMKSMSSKVYNTGYKLGDVTTQSISSAVARVSDLVESGIDSTPTIRPVLDLTDVKAGADSIGSMIGINPSIGVLSTVGSINSTMNQRSQNGVNDEVVSAINRLRKDLGNVGGNTYNINGVTYDDGTNVSNAVEALVRAVKIEGRV